MDKISEWNELPDEVRLIERLIENGRNSEPEVPGELLGKLMVDFSSYAGAELSSDMDSLGNVNSSSRWRPIAIGSAGAVLVTGLILISTFPNFESPKPEPNLDATLVEPLFLPFETDPCFILPQ